MFKTQCSDCSHNKICSKSKEYIELQSKVKEAIKGSDTIFDVSVKCKEYQGKANIFRTPFN